MRILITIILLSIGFTAWSQDLKRYFFVPDAEHIDMVTVGFCVTDKGKLIPDEVVKEQSNYRGKVGLDLLATYLEEFRYAPDSKYNGSCWRAVFRFVNEKYLDASLSEEDCAYTKRFKEGTFYYQNYKPDEVVVECYGNFQKEYDSEYGQYFDVIWDSDCAYTMVFTKMEDKELQHLVGKEIYVEIIGIIDENTYIYKSDTNFKDAVDYGVMVKKQ